MHELSAYEEAAVVEYMLSLLEGGVREAFREGDGMLELSWLG